MKQTQLTAGIALAERFCVLNGIQAPSVIVEPSAGWSFGVCAYYRNAVTHICIERCASIGRAGPAWSYPGYVADRTPYGVIQHELGHHMDRAHSTRRGAYFGDFSVAMREWCKEPPITSYCPNDAEWFAEMFRLFATNPDLLRGIRPRTYGTLRALWEPAEPRTWREVLRDAPARTVAMAERKVSE